MNTSHNSSIENRIANHIRWELVKGHLVLGQDRRTTMQHQLTDVRVRKGVVQGKSIHTGKWFAMAGWRVQNTTTGKWVLLSGGAA